MTLGRIPPGSLRKTMVLGELGLDGHVQEISGVFPAAAKARELDAQRFLFRPEMPRKGVWSAAFTSLESRIYRSF